MDDLWPGLVTAVDTFAFLHDPSIDADHMVKLYMRAAQAQREMPEEFRPLFDGSDTSAGIQWRTLLAAVKAVATDPMAERALRTIKETLQNEVKAAKETVADMQDIVARMLAEQRGIPHEQAAAAVKDTLASDGDFAMERLRTMLMPARLDELEQKVLRGMAVVRQSLSGQGPGLAKPAGEHVGQMLAQRRLSYDQKVGMISDGLLAANRASQLYRELGSPQAYSRFVRVVDDNRQRLESPDAINDFARTQLAIGRIEDAVRALEDARVRSLALPAPQVNPARPGSRLDELRNPGYYPAHRTPAPRTDYGRQAMVVPQGYGYGAASEQLGAVGLRRRMPERFTVEWYRALEAMRNDVNTRIEQAALAYSDRRRGDMVVVERAMVNLAGVVAYNQNDPSLAGRAAAIEQQLIALGDTLPSIAARPEPGPSTAYLEDSWSSGRHVSKREMRARPTPLAAVTRAQAIDLYRPGSFSDGDHAVLFSGNWDGRVATGEENTKAVGGFLGGLGWSEWGRMIGSVSDVYDDLVHLTGAPLPRWEFSKLDKRDRSVEAAVEHMFRKVGDLTSGSDADRVAYFSGVLARATDPANVIDVDTPEVNSTIRAGLRAGVEYVFMSDLKNVKDIASVPCLSADFAGVEQAQRDRVIAYHTDIRLQDHYFIARTEDRSDRIWKFFQLCFASTWGGGAGRYSSIRLPDYSRWAWPSFLPLEMRREGYTGLSASAVLLMPSWQLGQNVLGRVIDLMRTRMDTFISEATSYYIGVADGYVDAGWAARTLYNNTGTIAFAALGLSSAVLPIRGSSVLADETRKLDDRIRTIVGLQERAAFAGDRVAATHKLFDSSLRGNSDLVDPYKAILEAFHQQDSLAAGLLSVPLEKIGEVARIGDDTARVAEERGAPGAVVSLIQHVFNTSPQPTLADVPEVSWTSLDPPQSFVSDVQRLTQALFQGAVGVRNDVPVLRDVPDEQLQDASGALLRLFRGDRPPAVTYMQSLIDATYQTRRRTPLFRMAHDRIGRVVRGVAGLGESAVDAAMKTLAARKETLTKFKGRTTAQGLSAARASAIASASGNPLMWPALPALYLSPDPSSARWQFSSSVTAGTRWLLGHIFNLSPDSAALWLVDCVGDLVNLYAPLRELLDMLGYISALAGGSLPIAMTTVIAQFDWFAKLFARAHKYLTNIHIFDLTVYRQITTLHSSVYVSKRVPVSYYLQYSAAGRLIYNTLWKGAGRAYLAAQFASCIFTILGVGTAAGMIVAGTLTLGAALGVGYALWHWQFGWNISEFVGRVAMRNPWTTAATLANLQMGMQIPELIRSQYDTFEGKMTTGQFERIIRSWNTYADKMDVVEAPPKGWKSYLWNTSPGLASGSQENIDRIVEASLEMKGAANIGSGRLRRAYDTGFASLFTLLGDDAVPADGQYAAVGQYIRRLESVKDLLLDSGVHMELRGEAFIAPGPE